MNDNSSPNDNQNRNWLDLILITFFLLVINLPLLGGLLKIDPIPVYGKKNNTLPEKPKNFKELLSFPGKFKYYYTENFAFRGALILIHGQIMYNLFHISPSQKVELGEDNWLFLRAEGAIDDWRRLYPFSEEELKQWQKVLEARHQFASDLGIPYIFVITPDKHTIYGEYLPDYLTQANNKSRLDQLIDYLKKHNSPVSILDIRSPLKNASQNARTYHRTDTHWNLLGAYIGYKEIANKMKELGFPMETNPNTPITIKEQEVEGGDLARLMGLKSELKESRITVTSFKPCALRQQDGSPIMIEDIDPPGDQGTVTYCNNAKINSAVIFHDSFGKSLYPYLASNFKRSVFVWSNDFNPEIIKKEKPDIIIQQLVERRLFNSKPNLTEFGE